MIIPGLSVAAWLGLNCYRAVKYKSQAGVWLQTLMPVMGIVGGLGYASRAFLYMMTSLYEDVLRQVNGSHVMQASQQSYVIPPYVLDIRHLGDLGCYQPELYVYIIIAGVVAVHFGWQDLMRVLREAA